MSFIISIICGKKDVYIAADTKASSKSGLFKYADLHKIKPIFIEFTLRFVAISIDFYKTLQYTYIIAKTLRL